MAIKDPLVLENRERMRIGRVAPVELMRRVVVFLLIVAPLALQAWIVYRYGVNIPNTVEWVYAPFVRQVAEGGPWWTWLWHQFNENHFVVGMLIMAANVRLTGWNVVAQMYFSLLPSALSLAGLWLIYRRMSSGSGWLFVPAAWLLIHVRQYENYLFGIQIAFLFVVTGVIWTAYCLNRDTARYFLAAVLFGILTVFSAASGLFVWVMGLGQLLGQRARWQIIGAWAIVSGLVYAVYFYGFNSGHSSLVLLESLRQPVRLVQYDLTLFGSVIETADAGRAQIYGGLFLCCVALFFLYTVYRRRLPEHAAWSALALVLFAVIVTTLIALGRAQRDLTQALTSRYVSFTVLGVIGLYLVLAARAADSKYRSVFAWGIVPLLLCGIVAMNVSSLRSAVNYSRTLGRMNFFIARTQDLASTDLRKNLYSKKLLEDNLEDVQWLQSRSLSLFRDPVQWWLILPRAKAETLASLGPTTPIVQTFVCPVQTLYDVSVDVRPSPGVGTLDLKLFDARSDVLLAGRTIDANTLQRSERVFLTLASPLTTCETVPLRLELYSDSSPQNGLSTFAYPQFYEGVLTQAGQEILGSSLGMELNTQAYDIRDGR